MMTCVCWERMVLLYESQIMTLSSFYLTLCVQNLPYGNTPSPAFSNMVCCYMEALLLFIYCQGLKLRGLLLAYNPG